MKDTQIGIRLSVGEKAAVEELVRRRAEETGDSSVAGWFRAVLRRETKAAGVTIAEPDAAAEPAPAPPPTPPPAPRQSPPPPDDIPQRCDAPGLHFGVACLLPAGHEGKHRAIKGNPW